MFHSSASFPCPDPPAARLARSKVVTEQGSGQQAKQAQPITVGLLQHKLSKVGRQGLKVVVAGGLDSGLTWENVTASSATLLPYV